MNAELPDGDFLLLVDASSYFHRAYHAATKTVRRSDNQETGAIINFSWSLMKIFRLNRTAIGRRPSHAAIILDPPSRGQNFRHEIYPLYKAFRDEYEPGLKSQLTFIPEIADAFNIPCIAMDGWEADDIIATYADIAPREGLNVVIASSDKDLMQLVSGKVLMYDAMKDRDPERFDNSNTLIGIDQVKDKWGVFPWEMIDLQAIMGDAVDNVPGVPGIGPVKAGRLLREFGSVEAMLEEADWGAERFQNAKEHALIVEHSEAILLSKQLVELARNVPVELDIDDLRLTEADIHSLKEFFMSIEAPQLARRVDF